MKVCKGTNKKTKGLGCGVKLPYSERNGLKTYKATYGLGHDCNCYTNWLISDDPNAKEQFNKTLIQGRKNLEKKEKDRWNKKKAKISKEIESNGSINEKLQKQLNKIARLIDRGHKCLSSGKYLGMKISKYDGGHVTSVKANETIRFNLFNIYGQSIQDNQYLGGNEAKYLIGIGDTFGNELRDFVMELNRCPPLHLTRQQKRDATAVALSLVKWLELQDRVFTLEERISIRNDMNNALGIYDQEFCEFKPK